MKKQHKNVRLMLLIALLQGMVFYGPVATLYRTARGVSVFKIGLIEGSSLLLWILLEIPWGFVADRIGYRATLLLCNGLFFVSKVIFWRADSFSGFLAERLLLSVVCAGLSGCDTAYLHLATNESNRARVFSLYSAAGMAGLSVAAVTYTLFSAERYSVYGLLTVASYGAAALLTLLLGDLREQQAPRNFAHSVREISAALRQNKRFLLFLLGGALLLQANQTITVFLSQLQYLRAGISPRGMGLIYLAVTFAGLISASSAALSQKMGEQRMALLLFSGGLLACLLLWRTERPLLSVAGILLLRVAASLFTPLSLTLQNRSITLPDRASVLSVYSALGNLVAVVTSVWFGRVAERSVASAMLLGASFCAAGLLLFCVWQWREAFFRAPSRTSGTQT